MCTQLLSVVQFALAEQGISDVRYLDDFFLIAKSEEDMSRDLRLAQSVIRQFGLVINPDKTEGPAQQLSFLGVQLDSVAQTVSCTPERVGGAHCTAALPPPPASDHTRPHRIPDR